jgi:hypothetical protein
MSKINVAFHEGVFGDNLMTHENYVTFDVNVYYIGGHPVYTYALCERKLLTE